jgi:hypothetical protein
MSPISIVLLSTHPPFGLHDSHFLSDVSTKILHPAFSSPSFYSSFSSHSYYVLSSSHLIYLIILIILGEQYKLRSFLQPHVTSSFFDPNNFLSTLSSNSFSLCSYLNIRDQVSHLYRTTGRIVLDILMFTFLDSRREDKKFWVEW